MKLYRSFILVIVLLTLINITVVDRCFAERFYVGVSGGLSNQIGDDINIWKDEYIVRVKLLYAIVPRLMVGVTGGFNNWTPTNENLVGSHWDVRKDARIYEVYSSLRLYFLGEERLPVDIFIQGGLGLAIIDDAEVYTYPIIPNPPPAEKMEIWGDKTRAGLLFGGGLNVKISDVVILELMPTYSIIFHESGEDDTLDFYSVSLGMLFGI